MATSSNEQNILSELQRAAFEKWKHSEDYQEFASQLQLQRARQHVSSLDNSHVDIALNVREDGSVDVSMIVSENPTLSDVEELQEVLKLMPTSLIQPSGDLVDNFDSQGDGVKKLVDLERPQRLYLYLLQLQQLKEAKDLLSTSAGSPNSLYQGGLLELQHAAFMRWSDDGCVSNNINNTTPAKTLVELPNLKEFPESPQPTMGMFKEDPTSVHDLQPMLQQVVL